MPGYEANLNQTAVIYNKTTRDRYGKPSYGAGTSVSLRLDNVQRSKVLPNNQVVVIMAEAMVGPSTVVAEDDKLTLDGVNYRVFAVDEATAKSGDVHHIRLELTKWQV